MSTETNGTHRCDYCGASPAFPVVWTGGGVPPETLYLCPACDQREQEELEQDD